MSTQQLTDLDLTMPQTTLSARIQELTVQYGGLRAAARALETDAGYLLRLAAGTRTNPRSALLHRMGLRQVVVYERAEP